MGGKTVVLRKKQKSFNVKLSGDFSLDAKYHPPLPRSVVCEFIRHKGIRTTNFMVWFGFLKIIMTMWQASSINTLESH